MTVGRLKGRPSRLETTMVATLAAAAAVAATGRRPRVEVSAVHQLFTYLLAFSIGMVAVAALPRLRQRATARTRPERGRQAGERAAREATRLAEQRMAVAMWVVGCLLTGALAALVANLPG